WPDVVEYGGGIFLQDGFSEDVYRQWQERLSDDVPAIERVMNHRHVADMLPGAAEIGVDNVWYLGRTLAQFWECRLARLYPARRFVVTSEREEDEVEVVVTFYEDRA